MKRILLTGGTGLVGRNILPILREHYTIDAPTRQELNLLDEKAVEDYIKNNHYDIIIHSANPNGVKNPLDQNVNMVEGSLRCFLNFYRMREYYGKMFYLGSGAEFSKTRDMVSISENEFDQFIPPEEYGFGKYVMYQLASQTENVYNLRVFACYGPGDHESKFITHCIQDILDGKDELTIRQDCVFDYMHVYDLAGIILRFIEIDKPKYHDYNLACGEKHLLSEIADMVRKEMHSDIPIRILKEGRNWEYSASNERLLDEIGPYSFIRLKDGIKMQIESERELRR
ncbi:MAG: NAD(P)-dependent oxidoreductase [Clostridium lundense]|nr:NAD(P)-dependent oxidoreductase [Clostridium lundense]